MHPLHQISSVRLRFGLRLLFPVLLGLGVLFASRGLWSADNAVPAGRLDLSPKAHICIIGNTLADRMQHDGWLETYLHSRFPKHELVFRNLGFSGDELNLRLAFAIVRHARISGWPARRRSPNRTGSSPARRPREPLRDDQHQGRRGLRLLRLQRIVRRRGGTGQVQERPRSLHQAHPLPEVQRQERSAAGPLLADRPREFAKTATCPTARKTIGGWSCTPRRWPRSPRRTGVPFVDLFHPTRELYAKDAKPLTINGIHLNERGNEAVARIIDRALFADAAEPAIRKPWRNCARPSSTRISTGSIAIASWTVSTSTAAGPSRSTQDQQSNYEDQQRELEILDVKTSQPRQAHLGHRCKRRT